MLKKMVILAVVGFVAVTRTRRNQRSGRTSAPRSTTLGRMSKTASRRKRKSAWLRNEVKLLDKDMLGLVNQLAKENVEVAQLQEKVNNFSAKQE